jgi:hypothetical protein
LGGPSQDPSTGACNVSTETCTPAPLHVRLTLGCIGPGYSEGKTLTKEDEKTYWGKISYDDEVEGIDGDRKMPSSAIGTNTSTDEKGGNSGRRLYVKGSVIFGSGLEPLPVGRFIMSETTDSADDDDDDDDNEEESSGIDIGMDDGPSPDDFVDWSKAFQ